MIFHKIVHTDFANFSKLIFNIFGWVRRTPLLGPKGLTGVPLKAASLRRSLKKPPVGAIFLVFRKVAVITT